MLEIDLAPVGGRALTGRFIKQSPETIPKTSWATALTPNPNPHPALSPAIIPTIAPKADVGEPKYGRSPASRPTAIAVATIDVSGPATASHPTRTHIMPTKAPTTPPATAHGADTELLKQ